MCLSLIGDSFNFKFKAGKGIHFLNLIWSVSPSSIEWPTSSFWRLGLCHLSGWERGRETFYNIRYPTISIRLPFAVPEAKAPSSIERPTSAFWRLGLSHDGFVDERERTRKRHFLILGIRLHQSGYRLQSLRQEHLLLLSDQLQRSGG